MYDSIEEGEFPVTSDVPMLYDENAYKIYVLVENVEKSYAIVKVVSKVCGLNYIAVRNMLKEGENLIFEGNAYETRDVLDKLVKSEIQFEVRPPYPYDKAELPK